MELLTVKDLAQALGIGESTVRFWRDRFAEFIPYVGEGKRRRYRPEAAEVLRFIAERANRSENAESIAEALRHVFPKFIDIAGESQRSNAATQQQESQENRSNSPAISSIDLPAVLAAFTPLAGRYVTALERQAAALEIIAARMPLPEGTMVHVDAPDTEADIMSPGPSLEPRRREEIIAEVMRLRCAEAGMGSLRIAKAMNKNGWPTLSGRGKWGAGAVKRILKKYVSG